MDTVALAGAVGGAAAVTLAVGAVTAALTAAGKVPDARATLGGVVGAVAEVPPMGAVTAADVWGALACGTVTLAVLAVEAWELELTALVLDSTDGDLISGVAEG